mgnify:CR=1 FL=1
MLCFSAYWASNLFLWYPWSYSETLGIILMLTVTPLLWAYVTYLSLKTYPKPSWAMGALKLSGILLFMAISMDYVFFGHVRNAMEELYQPTTFYGYGFLLFWPFLLGGVLRKRLPTGKSEINLKDIRNALMPGLVCFGILLVILLLE